MLCTKIHIYDQFPVEWDAYLPKSMCRSAWKLSLKILLRRTVVNYLVKLKLKLGTVRSYPTTFLWSYSFYLWNLAPENAHGAQHFKSCWFLGQPRAPIHLLTILNVISTPLFSHYYYFPTTSSLPSSAQFSIFCLNRYHFMRGSAGRILEM